MPLETEVDTLATVFVGSYRAKGAHRALTPPAKDGISDTIVDRIYIINSNNTGLAIVRQICIYFYKAVGCHGNRAFERLTIARRLLAVILYLCYHKSVNAVWAVLPVRRSVG
jgi:hypothetical protein